MTYSKLSLPALVLATLLMGSSCTKPTSDTAQGASSPTEQRVAGQDDFAFVTDQFADLRILRYQVPGFEELSPKQKELLYYLSEAALAGRDITYDQNYKHNLRIRRTIDAILSNYAGEKDSEDFKNFETYAKRVYFSNGIHHHYSNQKMIPEISQVFFAGLVKSVPQDQLPLLPNETVEKFIAFLTPIVFDPALDAIRVNQDPDADLIATSAGNYYEGVTQKEVEQFYAQRSKKDDPRPVSHGLNSKLVKENGNIVEKVYKVGGMYSPAIERIVFWLEKASAVAENDQQKLAFDKLIEYYRTGDLKKFDEYNIAWVNDTESRIDVVNGFIEVYGDPLGYRGAYESVVSFKDMEATKRIDAISQQAQWFEDNSPIMPEHKKKDVKGITAKVITVVQEGGDAAPSTPIGINLPNANWIRAEHGSKSVNLGNIGHAYDMASLKGSTLDEFSSSPEELERGRQFGALAAKLHTDMHEVIGHASGKINSGVGAPKESLKNYGSPIEEARADLVALYFVMDPKLVEIGVMPSLEVGKAEYDAYIRNGLMTQLSRIKLGDNIQQAHMRNRQTVATWAYEKGQADNVIEKITRDGKTYFRVNDYEKLRDLFGQLLRETQRITSEGDYAAAQKLIETYGVKINQDLHKEVLARFEKLNVAPYSGFIQPRLVPQVQDNGRIINVRIEYPTDFVQQMLEYGQKYSFLPHYN
jgi:dipeptidyl-peptidase III